MSGARGFRLGAPRRTRRPSLTPMIDAVFLLLVFFMLASRFGGGGARGRGGGGADRRGGRRGRALVRPAAACGGRAGRALRVNGLAAPDIAAAPAPLTGEGAAGRLMALRGGLGARVRGIADAALALGRAGFSDIAAAP